MTEPELAWLACTDPHPMPAILRHRLGDRRFRLFACACCRRIWPLITSGASREAVRINERYADQMASWKEVVKARIAAELPWYESDQARYAVIAAAQKSVAASQVATVARYAVTGGVIAGVPNALKRPPQNAEALGEEIVAQSALVRDIFGPLPFRPVRILPAWLRWHDGAAVHLARTIYGERRFQDLPILADALEEAGCTDLDILSHCRQPGEHARGCWVVDLVLGNS
jgi:hypothetical protein